MIDKEKKILRLTLKKKWFDMIKSGIKKEEYREIKDYWIKRLTKGIMPVTVKENVLRQQNGLYPSYKFKNFDCIEFKNGYSKNAPTILVECIDITIGNAVPEWSDNWQGEVFVIKLGEIIKVN